MANDERGGGLAVWWGDPALTGSGSAGSFVLPAGTVGFLLTDVEASTLLWQADAEAMAAAMVRHAQILDAAVSAHGGVCPPAQGEGDSVVAAFARASDAVLAARDAQRALAAETWPTSSALRVRMAVHSGEARVVDDGNYAGQAIIRAARLRSIAHGGQVLISAAARDLTVDQLGDAVGLVDLGEHRLKDLARPEHVYQLIDAAVPTEFPALRSLDAHPHNLPSQLSSFIGRVDEIATVAALLDGNRLVTITGSGGSGKTRLALQVAAEVIDGYPDGVWWTELAEIVDPDLIAATIAGVLGVKAEVGEGAAANLAERLAERRVLLVLDNCEHLITGVAALAARVLRRAGGVAVLATSREALEVAGEVAWRIPPLAVPHRGELVPVGALSQYDAVRLFTDRARRVRPNFHLSDDNGPVVAGICEQLDGIPLAIELAAARCRSLSPAQILEGLTDAFRLLTGGGRSALPRQQTLEASIAWSHDLLSPPEQMLLRRLSVFGGGCTLDDAESVVADEQLPQGDVLDLLDRLVAQSLVTLDDTDDARYRVLETVRQYGVRRLDAADETSALRERHARHYSGLARRLGPQFDGPDDIAAFSRFVAEQDNMRVALDHFAGAAEWDDYAEMVCPAAWLWGVTAPAEAIARLSRPLDGGSVDDTRLVALLFCERAWTRIISGLVVEGLDDAERAAALAGDLGDDTIAARAAIALGFGVSWADPIAGAELLAAAAARCHDANLLYGETMATHFLATSYVALRQDMGKGLVALGRVEELVEELGSHTQLAAAAALVGIAASCQGDFRRALAAADRAEAALRALAKAAGSSYRYLGVSPVGATIQQVRATAAVATGQPRDVLDGLLEWSTRARADGAAWWYSTALLHAVHRSAGGELVEAIHELNELIAATQGVPLLLAWATAAAADALWGLGDSQLASSYANEVIRLTEQNGPFQYRCQAIICRAALALAAGELAAAEDYAHEALSLARTLLFRVELIRCFELLADIAAANQSWIEAARLHGAAARLRSDTGIIIRLPGYAEVHDTATTDADEALGHDAYTAAVAEGTALDLDAAVAYAQRARGERKRPRFGWDSLTPTERDVVDLVAAGQTNPQIGERLLISRETVKTHVGHVFTKLGVRNRAQLTAIAVEHKEAVSES